MHLARRREGIALVFWVQLLRQEPKLLHLLNPGQVLVAPAHFLGDEIADAPVVDQAGEVAVDHPVGASPLGDGGSVDLDQRDGVAASLTKHHRLADVWARLQCVLDVGRREVFPAGSHDDVALAVDEPERPVRVKLPDLPDPQPLAVPHLPCCSFVLPVAQEHARSPNEDLTVRTEAHGVHRRGSPHVPRAGKTRPLARDNAPCLGGPIEIDQIYAPSLPQRLDSRRQGGSSGDRIADAQKTHFSQDAPEDQVASRRVEGGQREGNPDTCPAPLDTSRCDPHRPAIGGRLHEGSGLDRHQHLRGDLLPHARNFAEERGLRLEERLRELLNTLSKVGNDLIDQREVAGEDSLQDVGHAEIGHRSVLL